MPASLPAVPATCSGGAGARRSSPDQAISRINSGRARAKSNSPTAYPGRSSGVTGTAAYSSAICRPTTAENNASLFPK